VVVTGVEVTDDLLIAKIGVRLLIADDDERERRNIVERLRRAAPRLRRAITPRLELKRAPELRFHYDTGPDAHQRVAELLREVQAEREAAPVVDAAPAPEGQAPEGQAPASNSSTKP
jgi:ribosome-binding factor A